MGAGVRPLQVEVPDVRTEGSAAEVHRQVSSGATSGWLPDAANYPVFTLAGL
ncbi:antitoxin MazE-like protein [[Mycobacterium] crassicus]|uniref:antitoxin MazE-like protein n=1 Tax=[Mycobacterium] crassicus TaxID=2872309 RepID=UPI0038B61AD3